MLRSLRALRPLRAVSQVRPLRVVVICLLEVSQGQWCRAPGRFPSRVADAAGQASTACRTAPPHCPF